MVSATQVFMATVFLLSGIAVVVAEMRGMLPEISLPSGDETTSSGPSAAQVLPIRIVLAVMLGFFAFSISGWTVAGLYGAVAGALLPSVWVSRRAKQDEIERIEAIASWVETIRDTMAASAGLQEALRLSAHVAPAPIRVEVRNMALRLQHQSVPQALRRFAGDIQHPLADQVVASIILASQRSAGSLRPILAMTSAAARDTASMWREINSVRAGAFAQARLAGIVSVLMMLFMTVQNRDFLEPFDSTGGQIALFFVLGAFTSSFVLMYWMARPQPPERIFEGIETWAYGEVGARPAVDGDA